MNGLQWWGVAVIALIVWNIARGALKAFRERRFGIRHVKWKDLFSALIGLIMGTIFFYGWFKYPDAPLHPCANKLGFCGKQGQPHSFAEYHQFIIWQTTLFVIWPIGMLTAFGLSKWRSKLDTGSGS